MPRNSLSTLLRGLRPEAAPGRFVFITFPDEGVEGVEAHATVREPEGMSAVISEVDARRLGFEYEFVAAWITLRVDSAPADVGLTAAVSACLTEAGISCNVIAGLHHDHLLVPADRAGEALLALTALSESAGAAN